MDNKEAKETKQNVNIEEIIIEGKYNPALFLPVNRAFDSYCQELIQRGLDTNETREDVQTDLIAKTARCSDRFRKRNRKVSDVKFSELNTCSYCDKKYQDLSKLLVYFLIAHTGKDPIVEELKKKMDPKTKDACILKTVVGWTLETKIRDVRSVDPMVMNAGCILMAPVRCEECMSTKPPGGAKIEIVD